MLRRLRKYLWLSLVGLLLFFGAGGTPALAAIPAAAPPVGPVGYVLVWQLNLRAGPSLDYGVVAIARYGEKVTLIGRTADSIRLKVRPVSGQEGWTLTRYIEASPHVIANLPILDGGSPPPPPSQPTAYVTVDRLNVRGGPGLNYDIIGKLWRGNVQPVIGRSTNSDWLQIRVSSTYPTFAEPTGWVLARYVRSSVPIASLPVTDGGSPPPPTDRFTGVVTASQLNVRSGPGLGYDVVGQITWGQQLSLLGRNSVGDWLKVDLLGGHSGWVSARYMSSSVPIYKLPVLQ